MPNRVEAVLELGEAERSLPIDRKLEEAQKAYEKAREHRRILRAHQRDMQRAMQRFDLFKADLEAMGVQVVIEPVTYPVRINGPTPRLQHIPQKEGTVDHRSSV